MCLLCLSGHLPQYISCCVETVVVPLEHISIDDNREPDLWPTVLVSEPQFSVLVYVNNDRAVILFSSRILHKSLSVLPTVLNCVRTVKTVSICRLKKTQKCQVRCHQRYTCSVYHKYGYIYKCVCVNVDVRWFQ